MYKYQTNYAAGRPQMYDDASRKLKAVRIIKTLRKHFGNRKLKDLVLLDLGASSGIIDNELAKNFKKVVGIDIDKEAIKFAKTKFKRKNLIFKTDDAMKLSFKEKSFDVVICTHVYEHVPDPKKMFDEIRRVLKPSGVCYLAAVNSLWPMEAHYNLPFLSYLPKQVAHKYVRLFGRSKSYYETPLSYWALTKLCNKFSIHDYTGKILRDPKTFGYDDKIKGNISFLSYLLSEPARILAPTFFWILEKK